MLMTNYNKYALLTCLALIKMVCNVALNLSVILNTIFFHLFAKLLNLQLSIYAGMYLHVL